MEIIFSMRKMFGLGRFDVVMRSTLINNILDEESKVGERGWLHAPHPEGLMASPRLLHHPEGLMASPCLLQHPEGLMASLLDEESRVGERGWLHAPHPEGLTASPRLLLHPEGLMASPCLLCSPLWMDGGHTRT